MRILGVLRCLILPHQPDRRRVRKAGEEDYFGRCTHCGARIRRMKRDRWVRTWSGPENAPE